jgi:hypothetical protein
MKAIHVVNAPPFADALVGVLKAAFKSKIAKRVSIITSLHIFSIA